MLVSAPTSDAPVGAFGIVALLVVVVLVVVVLLVVVVSLARSAGAFLLHAIVAIVTPANATMPAARAEAMTLTSRVSERASAVPRYARTSSMAFTGQATTPGLGMGISRYEKNPLGGLDPCRRLVTLSCWSLDPRVERGRPCGDLHADSKIPRFS